MIHFQPPRTAHRPLWSESCTPFRQSWSYNTMTWASSSLLVTGLHPSFKYSNFQRVSVEVSLGFCRVSAGFPKGFRRFPASFLGFSKGFCRVSAGFHSFCMGFCMVSAELCRFRAGFSICGRFSKGSAGFLGFPADLFGRFAGFSFFLKPAKAGDKLSRSFRNVAPNLISLEGPLLEPENVENSLLLSMGPLL